MAFCGYLKQSTAADILLGPCIDDTDGKSAETGLTLDVEVSKNGQALANKSDATAPAHDAAGTVDGYYNCELDATDTGTLGILTVVAHAAGFLPVRHDYLVVTANWYDSMCSTDILQSDLIQMGGVAQSGTDLKDFADAGYDPATNKVEGVKTVDTTTTNTDMVTEPPTAAAVVNEWETQSQADPTGFHVNVLEVEGTAQTANDNGADINTLITRVTAAVALASVCTEGRLAELDAGNLPTDIADIPTVAEFNARSLPSAAAAKLALSAGTIVTGTVSWDNTNATTTVIYSDDITEATADHFKGRYIFFTSGALQYQMTDITAYALDTGEGKFTVTATTEAAADNSTFIII